MKKMIALLVLVLGIAGTCRGYSQMKTDTVYYFDIHSIRTCQWTEAGDIIGCSVEPSFCTFVWHPKKRSAILQDHGREVKSHAFDFKQTDAGKYVIFTVCEPDSLLYHYEVNLVDGQIVKYVLTTKEEFLRPLTTVYFFDEYIISAN